MNVVGMDRLIAGATEYQIIHNLTKKKFLYFVTDMEMGKQNIETLFSLKLYCSIS